MMKEARRFFLLLWLCFPLWGLAQPPKPAPYEEAITLFDVQAAMLPDGVLDIKENIHFQARREQIKHGFFRNLPRKWVRPDDEIALLSYRVVGVTRDGRPEPWRIAWHSGTMSIVVGDEQVLLPEGDYQYQLHYQVSNAFLRDRDTDVLIWNVTGDGWSFKIYRTRFALQLPEMQDNAFQQIDLFTGERGETYKNGRILPDGSIESREPFYRQDFTVLYRWPHALLANAARPQTADIFTHLLIPDRSSLILWLPCLLLSGAFLYLWRRRPRFTPCQPPCVRAIPPDYPPGMLRLEAKEVYDDKGFCADVVNLIVKGRIVLEEAADSASEQYLIKVQPEAATDEVMTEAERRLLELLFRKGDKLVLKRGYNRVLRRAFLRMRKYYARQQKGAVYRPAAFWQCGGLATLATLILANALSKGWVPMIFYVDSVIGIFFFLPLLLSGMGLLERRDAGKTFAESLFITLLSPAAGGGLIFALLWIKIRYFSFYWFMPAGYVSAVCLTGYITMLGYAFLPRYTQAGQARFAWAQGAVSYLKTLEVATYPSRRQKGKSRQPDVSLLGWAIAAGLDRQWAAGLTPSLASATGAPGIASAVSLLALQSHLCAGANTSAAGSGGAGGGFSGGGAGGGGGGGW